MSLLTAQLRTSLGDPGMPLLFGMDGCGVTLDDRMIEEFVVGAGTKVPEKNYQQEDKLKVQ